MSEPKKIGFVFIPAFADWEFGLLSGPATDWFGLKTVALTPDGEPVTSIGGFHLSGERSLDPAANTDLDAVAVIGSDTWPSADAPDISPLLHAVAQRGGLVGGICGGTLALARAGLFDGVEHTSNGRDWILKHLPDYAGRDRYRDVPHAVADGRIVSAPGSAPGTFALEFVAALLPAQQAQLAEMRALFGKEYGQAS